MTKANLAASIHERIGLSKKESVEMVQLVLDQILLSLKQGEDVKISGFGHFKLRDKKARPARNPKTGEELMLAPRRVVTFRASPILKDQVHKAD